MTTPNTLIPTTLPRQDARPGADLFQTGRISIVAAAHFINDIYTAYLAPLLPALIEKFSLSLTQASILTTMMQLPSLLNPVIGYLADRLSVRYFIILTPAVTATLMSSLGLAPNYASLAVILFAVGISTACFHAPAPAMISSVSGRRIGLGMGVFMASGEFARTAGPLLAIWAISLWGLDGLWRTAVLGWAASLLLFLRLRNVNTRPLRSSSQGSLAWLGPALLRLFLPLALVNLFIDFMLESLTTFLPTYMKTQGASLAMAAAAYSIFSLTGAVGALTSGPLSDRIGRRLTIAGATVISAALMLLFLQAEGALIALLLLALGLFALSRTAVMMALVQEYLPEHRATANGIYMVIAFLLRPVAALMIGFLGDRYGLHAVFFWSAFTSLLALPFIYLLPETPRAVR